MKKLLLLFSGLSVLLGGFLFCLVVHPSIDYPFLPSNWPYFAWLENQGVRSVEWISMAGGASVLSGLVFLLAADTTFIPFLNERWKRRVQTVFLGTVFLALFSLPFFRFSFGSCGEYNDANDSNNCGVSTYRCDSDALLQDHLLSKASHLTGIIGLAADEEIDLYDPCGWNVECYPLPERICP